MSGSASETIKASGSSQKALPIALTRFLKELEGTKYEVYSTLLRMTRNTEKHTRAEWQKIVESLGTAKVAR